jgi:hypothetical protein
MAALLAAERFSERRRVARLALELILGDVGLGKSEPACVVRTTTATASSGFRSGSSPPSVTPCAEDQRLPDHDPCAQRGPADDSERPFVVSRGFHTSPRWAATGHGPYSARLAVAKGPTVGRDGAGAYFARFTLAEGARLGLRRGLGLIPRVSPWRKGPRSAAGADSGASPRRRRRRSPARHPPGTSSSPPPQEQRAQVTSGRLAGEEPAAA